MNISELLQHINTTQGTAFELVGQYTDGEQGAFAIRDQQGKRYVHDDFQPYNILVENHHVSGVIDWGGVHAGDCVFDLITLLFYAYNDLRIRKHLWDTIVQRCSQKLLSVYMAHMILRQVDWSLRYHNYETIDRYVSMSESILDDITNSS